jgi:hypothetical protein
MVCGISGSPTTAGLWPENTGFLAANAFAIRPQPVGMIQRDAGDHGDIGIHDIGGIKTPAEPHLRITTSSCACLNSHSAERAVFKIGQ